MTVSSVDLGSVCASLMDISLQLLASVKCLERSLTQVSISSQLESTLIRNASLLILIYFCRSISQSHPLGLRVLFELVADDDDIKELFNQSVVNLKILGSNIQLNSLVATY